MIRSCAPVVLASLALIPSERVAAQGVQLAPAAQGNGKQGQANGSPLVSIRATGVDQLLKAWPNTKIGKLMADEDVVDAATAVLDFSKSYLARRDAVRNSVIKLDMLDELEPYEVAGVYGSGDDLWQVFRFPVAEVTRGEMVITMPDDMMTGTPSFVTRLSCSPRYEGRWTQAFEKEAAHLRSAEIYKEIEGTKINGFPAYAFKAPESVTGETYADNSTYARWMMHTPGTFAYGNGQVAAIEMPTAKDEGAELALELDLEAYFDMFQRMGMGVPASFAALGFDNLKTLKWSGRFRGELIEDQLAVTLNDKPTGLVGALLTGTGELPAQALPKGAIAQLRSSANLAAFAEVLPVLTEGVVEIPEELVQQVLTAFDGGLAISCCAPAPGGVIPRLYLSAGIADQTALDGLFAKLLTDNLPTKKVKYSGIECTVLKIPDMPNGIQPAFCIHKGTLHVAESALSLRAFLKVQDDDTVAMDVGDAPMPKGAGEQLPAFDWRFDEAKLYQCFYENWLPLYELAAVTAEPAPVRRKDLPEPDVVELYCGKSRGVLRKDGDEYSVVLLGALGGPELAALAMTWGPMLANQMTDWQTDRLSMAIAKHKLEAVHTSLESFQKREKRLPKNLGELFVAEKLADDALMLPGDDLAETFTTADGRKLKSSFRYFDKPVTFRSMGDDEGPTIFIEVRTRSYNRITMTTEGVIPDSWGEDNQKPIDQFGKGGSDGPESVSAPAGHTHK